METEELNNFFYYSNSLPKILKKLNGSLVFSTYQANRLIFLSSPDGEKLIKYAKSFDKPMGIAFDEKKSKIALASKTCIDVFTSSEALAKNYPEKKNKFDYLFIPQVKYHTGYLDTHEMEYGSDGELYFVNTMFSCISKLSAEKHFEFYWKPYFIKELTPTDQCHLNGMAMKDGKPAYVTIFERKTSTFGWKKSKGDGGLLMDVNSNKVILDNLQMPHSPVYFDNKIYFLSSGSGTVNCYDIKTKETKLICRMNTFVRGLQVIDNYLIVAASKMREGIKETLQHLNYKSEDTYCGIYIIDRFSGKKIGGISYVDLVSEIFDVKLLNNIKVPAILNDNDTLSDKNIMADPNLNFWIKKKNKV